MKSLKINKNKRLYSKKIQTHKINPNHIIIWLKKGARDLTKTPSIDLFYGFVFWLLSYGSWYILSSQQYLKDIIGPVLGIIILILGPIAAISIYRATQKINSGEDVALAKVIGIAFKENNSSSSVFLSLFIMIIASAWMLGGPLMYAIFNSGSIYIVSDSNSIVNSIINSIINFENMPFLIAYGIYTIIVAWFAFMISWFSFPMVLDKNVDPFTAAVTSLEASIKNKFVMLLWTPIVGILLLIALLIPYFLGLIIVIPLIAHATWHAYTDLIGDMQEEN